MFQPRRAHRIAKFERFACLICLHARFQGTGRGRRYCLGCSAQQHMFSQDGPIKSPGLSGLRVLLVRALSRQWPRGGRRRHCLGCRTSAFGTSSAETGLACRVGGMRAAKPTADHVSQFGFQWAAVWFCSWRRAQPGTHGVEELRSWEGRLLLVRSRVLQETASLARI